MARENLSGQAWLESERRRARDCALALLGVTALAPLCASATALKYIEDRKTVLFSQERVGRNAEPFYIFKLRTMDRSDHPERDGHSITSMGKWLRAFKLDEIPQFLNVLNGTMSIVGPRPLLVREFIGMKDNLPRTLYEEWLDAYCSTTPGIVSNHSMYSGILRNPSHEWEYQMRAKKDIGLVHNASPTNDWRVIGMTAYLHTIGRLLAPRLVEQAEPALAQAQR